MPDGAWVGHWATTLAAAATVALAEGKSAILAVPDYRDQQQLETAPRPAAPERIVQLDTRQSNADRYRAFLRCLEAEALVIVGNRSVVYAPASKLGLLALWDDGDPLHSEPLAPVCSRPRCRTAAPGTAAVLPAVPRAFPQHRGRTPGRDRLARISVAGAQCAPESHSDARTGRRRSAGRHRRGYPPVPGEPPKQLSRPGPVLVQVARPGYSPRLACVDCGQSARCLRCEGPLAQKSARSIPACSWCGALAVDWRCEQL